MRAESIVDNNQKYIASLILQKMCKEKTLKGGYLGLVLKAYTNILGINNDVCKNHNVQAADSAHTHICKQHIL